ncbi:MAG: O-antigen ligase family protein [Terriglobales bacterium]
MILFYLLVAGMPLVNQPLMAHFADQLTMTKYLGLAAVAYAAVHLALKRRMPDALHSVVFPLLLAFYVLVTVSYFTRSLPMPWQLSPFLSYTSFFVLCFVVAAIVDTPERLRITLLVAIGSVAIGSLYVLREWQKYHTRYVDFRPGYVVGDANYFTLSAVVCLPLALFLLRERRPWQRAALVVCVVLTLLAVALAASRGGFLALLAALGYLWWRSAHRIRNLGLIALVLVPLVAFAPDSAFHRLVKPDYSDQEAVQNRLVVWRAGLKIIADHPLTGIGLGNFKPMVEHFEHSGLRVDSLAHNTYIQLAADLGLPGLTLFLVLFSVAFVQAARAVRASGPGSLLWLAGNGIQAGLLGCAVGVFFLSAGTQKLIWLMLALCPCLAALARRSQLANVAASAPAGNAPSGPPALPPSPAQPPLASGLPATMPVRAREMSQLWR